MYIAYKKVRMLWIVSKDMIKYTECGCGFKKFGGWGTTNCLRVGLHFDD